MQDEDVLLDVGELEDDDDVFSRMHVHVPYAHSGTYPAMQRTLFAPHSCVLVDEEDDDFVVE